MTQTILQFELGITGEQLTANDGLVIFAEFLYAKNLLYRHDAALPVILQAASSITRRNLWRFCYTCCIGWVDPERSPQYSGGQGLALKTGGKGYLFRV